MLFLCYTSQMKLQIEKIHINDLSYEAFVDTYLIPEKPVVITGLDAYDKEKITPAYVSQTFQQESRRNIGWYDAAMPTPEENIYVPDIIREIFSREDMSERALPMRIFLQPKGHQTLFHYDGNSLHVFNLQIKGKKVWRLISPNTPIPSAPFLIASLVGKDFQINYDTHDACEIVVNAGEMLFLPRYWIHDVGARADININYNWVITPRYPSHTSPIAKRELELLKLRRTIPLIDRLMLGNYGDYGGEGERLVKTYIQKVSATAMITRFLKEIKNIPSALLLKKEIKAMAADFERNNFNIK